jgi:hypothetical protein
MSLWNNRPKCSPTHFVSKLMHYPNREKAWYQNLGYFCTFKKTAQSKKSPNGRIIAQSGHPGCEDHGSMLWFSKYFRRKNGHFDTHHSNSCRKILKIFFKVSE